MSYYLRIVYTEEDILRKKFGIFYLEWANKTPTVIPSFKNFKKPRGIFSIAKVLSKEKNAFAAVFLLFWLFDWLSQIITEKTFQLNTNFWFFAAIISLLLYTILKILKKFGHFS